MLPSKKSPLWDCQYIYRKLLNPYTQTVGAEYFLPILKKQFQYCKKSQYLLSLAMIKISPLPTAATNYRLNLKYSNLLKEIISKIRADLCPTDMIFYDGDQEITLLLPGTPKSGTQKLLQRIETDLEQIYIDNSLLVINGGYAEFPTDSIDFIKLQECTTKALSIATKSQESRIIGYFTEGRKAVRIPLKIEVRYTAPGFDGRITCSRNISEEGIMISGMPDLPLGNDIELTFKLPDIAGTKIGVTAKTIWNRIRQKTGKMDIGLCFIYINGPAKQKIKAYIQGIIPPITHL